MKEIGILQSVLPSLNQLYIGSTAYEIDAIKKEELIILFIKLLNLMTLDKKLILVIDDLYV